MIFPYFITFFVTFLPKLTMACVFLLLELHYSVAYHILPTVLRPQLMIYPTAGFHIPKVILPC